MLDILVVFMESFTNINNMVINIFVHKFLYFS